MGPSQFIPSTWASYASRIALTSGDGTPSPWSAKDAIAAMSLYLKDLGAGTGTYTAEHTAAAKYYAGSNWATRGQSYGDQVMDNTGYYQNQIDLVNGT